MTGTVIVIRPSATLPTRLSHIYAGELIDWLNVTGVEVIDIQKGLVSQPSLYAALSKVKIESETPPIVCYYGHGFADKLVGDELAFEIPFVGEHLALVKEGFNTSWFNNCIVYSYACLSGLRLGPSIVKSGALAYYGGTGSTYVGFPEGENDYSKDFAVMANTIPKAIVNGYSLCEAMILYRKTCDYYVAQYKANNQWDNAEYYAFAAKSNRDTYRLLFEKDLKWSGV